MRKSIFSLITFTAGLGMLTSCLKDNNEDYTAWQKANDAYMAAAELAKDSMGDKLYTRISPDWAPGVYVLMKWHNDTSLTSKNLKPLYNSTCNTTYRLRLIDESVPDSSFSNTANGDSIYQSQPSSNVVGFAVALMNMHVGDSCTVVIPYTAGYGNLAHGKNIKPFSTLIFDLKLKEIPAYEKK